MLNLEKFEYPTEALARAAWVSNFGMDVASGGVASANLETQAASNAFDNVNSTFWQKNGGSTGWLKYDLGEGNAIACDGYSIYYQNSAALSVKSWQFQGSNDDTNWVTLDTQANQTFTIGTKKIYWFARSAAYRYYRLNITAVNDINTLIHEFEILQQGLSVTTDSSEKEQGSYSLKIVAQNTALNKTITRTLSPTWNLSGQTSIKLFLRASRTGSNFKIGFHDSGGTTTEVTPNIASADTFQEVTLDISAVADANKDAIDSIILTITNADAENTIYLDNLYADDGTSGSGSGGVSRSRILGA